jgi:hypothetical protein
MAAGNASQQLANSILAVNPLIKALAVQSINGSQV